MMTQGRGDGNEWVTAFMISYSMNAFNWYYVKDQYGNQKVCNANVLKAIKIRCVLVISLITDKRLGTIKPSTLSINNRQVEAQ